MDDQKIMFRVEEEAIKQAQAVLSDDRYQNNPLLAKFSALFKSYKKMYEQLCRLIKLGDSQQLQLKRAYEKIEAQKRQLERQNQELLEAARLREDVDQITRHDLKSPLTSIISIPRVIMMNKHLTKKDVEFLKMMEKAGLRMLNMINLSLDLFKMERGKYQLQPVAVNLVPVIRNIALETRNLIHSKQLTLDVWLSGRPAGNKDMFLVKGEELLCYVMLSNLIKNALEASPDGECVRVTLDVEKNDVTIRIHNKGVVPKPVRDGFFGKYVTFGKDKGTGLGTYSSKLIAETQQGSIHMSTSEEDGTTITIRLPKGIQADQSRSFPDFPILSAYQEQEEQAKTSEDNDTWMSDALAALPKELVESLQQAVESLNVNTTDKLVDQIHQHNTALAESLAKLVREHRFDVLQMVLSEINVFMSQRIDQ
jgi:two-component system sensor histidine kinase/response regulator